MTKRWPILVVIVCCFALPAFAQRAGPFNITATSPASAACAPITVSANSSGSVKIVVSGTWSATLQPQEVVAGQSPVNINVTPSGSLTPQGTITANDVYTVLSKDVAGADSIQVCATAYTSGTAVVNLNASTASAGLGGGGSGSSFGPVTGTALQIGVANGSTAPVISITNPAVLGVLTAAGGTLTTDVQTFKTTQTYNNGAQLFNGLLNVTVDTAHAAGSMLRQDLCGVAGTTVCQSLDPSGNTINLGSSTASSQNAVGTGAGVLQVTQGPANSASANSAGFMAPTSIPTAYVILMPTAAATCPGVFTLGTVSAGVSQGGFSCAPALGIDNSVAGSIQLASLAAAAHTIITSVATTSNTVNFPATTPVDSDLLCASVPTSNVLTIADCGVLKTNLVTAAGTLTSTALMTGGGSKAAQTPCATCTLSSGGQIVLVAGGSLGSADVNTPTITFAASKISVSQPLTLGVTSNQLVSGTSTNLTTITFPASSGAVTVTMPNTTTSVVSAAAALTSTAFMTGGGTALSQTPSATSTLSAGGNASFAGTVAALGACGSGTAGCLVLPQGSAQGHATANAVVIEAPAAVTAFEDIWPGTSATGFLYGTNAAAVRTESFGELSSDATTSGSLAVTVVGGLHFTSDLAIPTGGTLKTVTNAPLNVQSGLDATTTGAAAILTLRGEDITGGSTASITGGAVALRGGNTASTGNSNGGGAVTINGGNATGGTGTTDTGGNVSETGGNCTATTGSCTPGSYTATAGGFTAAFTNGAASDAVLAGGLGTGNAAPSHYKLKSPALGLATGTAAEAQITRLVTHVKAGSTTTATATNMFNIASATNTAWGVDVVVHVDLISSTPNVCSTTERFSLSGTNNNGAFGTVNVVAGTLSTLCSTGTLTLAMTATAANPSVIAVTPSWGTITSITSATITITIENVSQQEIALL